MPQCHFTPVNIRRKRWRAKKRKRLHSRFRIVYWCDLRAMEQLWQWPPKVIDFDQQHIGWTRTIIVQLRCLIVAVVITWEIIVTFRASPALVAFTAQKHMGAIFCIYEKQQNYRPFVYQWIIKTLVQSHCTNTVFH